MTSNRGGFSATAWWAVCGLWAYVVWGVLVVTGGLPEFLGALAVLGTFILAGKRVAASEASPALIRSALVAVGLTAIVVFLVPLVLLNLGASQDQVTLFLLGSSSLTCLLARRTTRPPMPQPDALQQSARFVTVLGWVIALGVTAIATFLTGSSS